MQPFTRNRFRITMQISSSLIRFASFFMTICSFLAFLDRWLILTTSRVCSFEDLKRTDFHEQQARMPDAKYRKKRENGRENGNLKCWRAAFQFDSEFRTGIEFRYPINLRIFSAIVHSFSVGYWFHRVAFLFASCSRVLNDLCPIWLQKRKEMTHGFAIAMTIWISMRERYFIRVFFPQVFFRYCSLFHFKLTLGCTKR